MPKHANTGKNKENEKSMISDTSLTLRRLGSSRVLTTNPQVARSSRAGCANKNNGLGHLSCSPFFVSVHIGVHRSRDPFLF